LFRFTHVLLLFGYHRRRPSLVVKNYLSGQIVKSGENGIMKPKLAILGAAGGIGRVLTEKAIEAGWCVIALDLEASLAAHPPPPNVEVVEVDICDPKSIESGFANLGELDGFVNLAGFMSPHRPLVETLLEDFDEVMTGNLRGAFLACSAALPLLHRRRGAMVNVASGLGAHARPGFGPYAAAKAGMISLTKTFALEAAPEVRVNAVGPSAIDTAFLRGGEGRTPTDSLPIDFEVIARATPLGRMAKPDDVAGPILFLLSEDARFITGQVLWINGGSYMP
jgi:NAD(P)-dependent dehydrogenase (short-subunit alcohol dehydrogenase family)